MNAYCYQADLWCEECARQIMFDIVADALTKAGVTDARRELIWSGEAFEIVLPPEDMPVVGKFIPPSGADYKAALPDYFTIVTETDVSDERTALFIHPPDDENQFDSDEWPKGPESGGGGESDSPQHCGGGETCLNRQQNGFYSDEVGVFLENSLTSDGYSSVKEMLDEYGETLPPAAQEWAGYYSFNYHKQPFESAHDWLDHRITELCASAEPELVSITRELARIVDGDQIQDLFQSDMDSDGYFEPTGWTSDEAPEPDHSSNRTYRAGYEHAAGYHD